MENKLLEMIREVNPYADLSPDMNLIEEGVLDSLGILFFIECLEKEYGFKMPEKELKAENFVTLSAVRAMVERVCSA